jgi:chromate transporter
VRAGKVRVGLFLPQYSTDPATGEIRAQGTATVTVPIARALAARLGIDLLLVAYQTPLATVESLNAGASDLAFLGPSWSAAVGLSPPFVIVPFTYLVPYGSPITRVADADRPGMRIAVARGHEASVALDRVRKHAEPVVAETPDAAFELLCAGKADVFAMHILALQAFSTRLPGSRVLEDHYGTNPLAMAVPKAKAEWLAYVSRFLEEAKASGLVQETIEHAAYGGCKLRRRRRCPNAEHRVYDREKSMNDKTHSRLEVVRAFLKLGAMSYGGPAIWGVIQSELQERRRWLTKERYLEGLALVQALPGAPAVQMCIFAGHERAGWWAGVLAGLAFMAPAFAIMVVLAGLHSAYGALPFMRDAFYGLGPVVLGIFIVAVWRLGGNAIKGFSSIVIALAAALAVAFTPLGIAATFLLAGCAGVALHHSRRAGLWASLAAALLIAVELAAQSLLNGLGASSAEPHAPSLWNLSVFFLKVGAMTFGGGISILAFVQDQVVNQYQWITAQEFLEGLTLGQFTPGPIIMVAAFIGYKVAGLAGAAVVAAAIFLPSFVLMLSILPVLDRVRSWAWIRAAIRGISPAVIGSLCVTIVHLAPHAAPDAFTAVVLVLTVLVLLAWRLPVLPLLAAGGLVGILARSRLLLRLRELV